MKRTRLELSTLNLARYDLEFVHCHFYALENLTGFYSAGLFFRVTTAAKTGSPEVFGGRIIGILKQEHFYTLDS